MVKNNYYLATWTLVIITCGFLLTYPISHTFYGGLLFSIFSAALIGGIADWFAVTSLFRKPLGVPSLTFGLKKEIIRTEIISKNRQKIITMIGDMVKKELLTKEILQTKVDELNLLEVFFYLYKKESNLDLRYDVIETMCSDLVDLINTDTFILFLNDVVKKEGANIPLSRLISHTITHSCEHGIDKKIILYVLKQLNEVIYTEEFIQITTKIINDVKNNYEKDNNMRKMATTVLFDQILKQSSSEIAIEIRGYMHQLLIDLQNENHPLRIQLHIRIHKFTLDLLKNEELINRIEQWKIEQLQSPIVKEILFNFINQSNKKQIIQKTTKYIDTKIRDYLQNIEQNKVKQKKIEGFIKRLLKEIIHYQYNKLDVFIMEKLQSFKDEDLVTLIEQKAGNDLQIIRINGSVVGGLVGSFFYLITYWL